MYKILLPLALLALSACQIGINPDDTRVLRPGDCYADRNGVEVCV